MSTTLARDAVPRQTEDTRPMHEFGRYLREQMDRRGGWTPSELGRNADLSRSHVSKLMKGPPAIPRPATIAKLATALRVPESDILLHAAQAVSENSNGSLLVDDGYDDALTDEELIYELTRRLRDCSPVIEPLAMARDSLSFTQTVEVRALLDELTEDARAAGQEWRATVIDHLGKYLDALDIRSNPPTTGS